MRFHAIVYFIDTVLRYAMLKLYLSCSVQFSLFYSMQFAEESKEAEGAGAHPNTTICRVPVLAARALLNP